MPTSIKNPYKQKKRTVKPVGLIIVLLMCFVLTGITMFGFYQSGSVSFSYPLSFNFLESESQAMPTITPDDISAYGLIGSVDGQGSTTETTLKVIHPNEQGGGFVIGQSMPIVWKNTNLPKNSSIDTVDITLLSSNGLEYPVPIVRSDKYIDGYSGYFNPKGYSTYLGYVVKSYVPPGDGYRVKIRCLNCASLVEDTSDGSFRIIPASRTPSINFIYPSFHDVVKIGSTIDIKWRTSNINSDSVMDLELYQNKDGGQVRSIAVNEPSSINDGVQSYTIPADLEPGEYKIQISCRDCVDDYGYNPAQWGGVFTISN